MKHGSLFSGIGGFDLAAEWMGWENVFHCEWMEFPRKVLDYHFPNADSHIDICKTDFKKYANTIDILTGGFPCQPFSLAGKRKGTDDERYLWGEMLRAIQEIKPKFVIAENVFGITNIDGGLVFQQVCLDLENEGYEVQPFIIPAAAKNAPHRRDRCWFIAYSKNNGQSPTETIDKWGECKPYDRYKIRDTSHTNGTSRDVTNTKCNGLEHGNKAGNIRGEKTKTFGKRGESTNVFEANGCDATNTNGNGFNECNGINEINTSERGEYAFNDIEQISTDSECVGRTEIRYDNGQFETPQQSERREQQFSGADSTQSGWRNFPSQPPVCSGDDGIPRELDGITFSKWRAESIKGYGNAIVPQIAYQLFEIIQELNENN
jgi:DNA (cytosine-5)-methyltransferase 1